ncbi:MAG: hypothetical protein WC815_19085 [Vicinamibacterales bacterium]|jgi:hypothetical protein
MITDLIVVSSVVFTVAFTAAWWRRPDFRAWIERPKFDFQRAVQGYDRAQRPDGDIKRSHSA